MISHRASSTFCVFYLNSDTDLGYSDVISSNACINCMFLRSHHSSLKIYLAHLVIIVFLLLPPNHLHLLVDKNEKFGNRSFKLFKTCATHVLDSKMCYLGSQRMFKTTNVKFKFKPVMFIYYFLTDRR